MKRILLISFLLVSTLASQAWAQGRTVTGTVTSEEDSYGMPGVTVMVKGTAKGTTTDMNGKYEIGVPEGDATLVFSFIGMATQEVKVGARSVIDVALSADVKQLTEVVVMGYTKLDEATEVQSIEKINEVVAPDIANAIQGKATGVNIIAPSGQPGAKTNVRIRGRGSLSGSSEPLYVIDGVILNADEVVTAGQQAERDPLAMLNQNDIADIKILKDAAATALYGARAANGVIVVTTKRGAAGQTKFSLNVKEGITDLDLDQLQLMNGQQSADFVTKLAYGSDETPDVDPATGEPWRDTNWRDLAFRTGRTKDYQVSASGGSQNSRFYASAGYFTQEGVLEGSAFDRYSARINLDNNVGDKVKFTAGADVSYVDQEDASDGNLFSSPLLASYMMTPILEPFDENGEPYQAMSQSVTAPYTAIDANFLYDLGKNYRASDALIGGVNTKLTYSLTPALTFSSANSARAESAEKRNYWDARTYDGQDTDGSISVYNSLRTTITTTNLASYEKTFADVHKVSALGGMEYQHNFQEWGFASGDVVPVGMDNLRSAAANFLIDGRNTEYKFFSILSQLKYSYDDKYFASASFRRDGSSRFGANNRFGNFYSVGATWMISNESFLEGSNVDNLKLYTSYGTTGSAEIGDNASLGLYRYDAYFGQAASEWIQLPNEDLTWESKKKANLGIDFGYNNWLDVNVNLYHETSTNLLLNIPLAGSTGFTRRLMNAGEMTNKGLEVMINTTNVDNGAFSWTTTFNMAMNRNMVTELYDGKPIEGTNTTIQEGLPAGAFYMIEWAGAEPETGASSWYVNRDLTEAEKEDANFYQTEDGRWATTSYGSAEKAHLGNPTPDVSGGLINNFKFKGFDASFFLAYSYGNKIYNSTRRYIDTDYMWYYNHLAEATEDRWEEPGDIASRPAYGDRQGRSNSSRYLEDGSYIQLRNITLGYTLPTNIASKVKLSRVRIYASAQNLFTFSNYKGYTPTAADEDGYTFFEYPQSRVFTGGLTIDF